MIEIFGSSDAFTASCFVWLRLDQVCLGVNYCEAVAPVRMKLSGNYMKKKYIVKATWLHIICNMNKYIHILYELCIFIICRLYTWYYYIVLWCAHKKQLLAHRQFWFLPSGRDRPWSTFPGCQLSGCRRSCFPFLGSGLHWIFQTNTFIICVPTKTDMWPYLSRL